MLVYYFWLCNISTIPKIRQRTQCARGTNRWNDSVERWERPVSQEGRGQPLNSFKVAWCPHPHTLHPCTRLTKCLNCCQSTSCRAETCPKHLMASQNCVWSICLETLKKWQMSKETCLHLNPSLFISLYCLLYNMLYNIHHYVNKEETV